MRGRTSQANKCFLILFLLPETIDENIDGIISKDEFCKNASKSSSLQTLLGEEGQTTMSKKAMNSQVWKRSSPEVETSPPDVETSPPPRGWFPCCL